MGASRLGEAVTPATTAASKNRSYLLPIVLMDSNLVGCSAPKAEPR